MELAQYIRITVRWAWLLVLATLIGGGLAFIIRIGEPPQFKAQTVLAIGTYIESPNPNSTEIRTGIDLAQTYAELVKTYDILQATIDELALDIPVEDLQADIETRLLAGTSLLVIEVEFNDPVIAADIANALATQLILNSPTNITQEQQEQIELARAQIAILNEQLSQLRGNIASLNEEIVATDDGAEITRLTFQRDTVVDQINATTATIAQFNDTIATIQQRTNSIDVVEQARIPNDPSGSSVWGSTVLGAIIGFAISFGIVLTIEYLDNTIKSSAELVEILRVPSLGVIARFGKKDGHSSDKLIINSPGYRTAAEGYRKLRTNLLYAADRNANPVFIVTSPNMAEGKTITAANLAASLALDDKRVLLIDGDLRRPRVHEVFELDNIVGLTTPLLNLTQSRNGTGVLKAYEISNQQLQTWSLNIMQKTHISNLSVVTSGMTPNNPSEILGSSLMQRLVREYRESNRFDVILIDTPPCLAFTDSTVVAAATEGNVILVAEARRTHHAAVLRAKEEFERVGHPILGTVLNGVDMNEEFYYYGYGYASYYLEEPPIKPEIIPPGS